MWDISTEQWLVPGAIRSPRSRDNGGDGGVVHRRYRATAEGGVAGLGIQALKEGWEDVERQTKRPVDVNEG